MHLEVGRQFAGIPSFQHLGGTQVGRFGGFLWFSFFSSTSPDLPSMNSDLRGTRLWTGTLKAVKPEKLDANALTWTPTSYWNCQLVLISSGQFGAEVSSSTTPHSGAKDTWPSLLCLSNGVNLDAHGFFWLKELYPQTSLLDFGSSGSKVSLPIWPGALA
ncbi:uncharacterized protein LOC143273232 [Peromyscus maniculatus bairdii]|uniref:uncharacterized protein LOC143273232 n=1 Tax=Peromyscus maniculatus bairdii TaxID=230844 RepID=UPI003FD3BED6